MKTIQIIFISALLAAIVSGCNGDDPNGVAVRGLVDDGTANSPLAGARCVYLNDGHRRIDQTRASAQGEFILHIPPDQSGFVGCFPAALPNLVLVAYFGTMGASEGETLPQIGREEVSPRTTVIANIIAHTSPPDPQARKEELMVALADEEPDMTMLAGAATELFNAMLDAEITDQDFSDLSGEDVGPDASEAPDSGGTEGDAGDGSVFSPLAGALCKFDGNFIGDTALDDFFTNGAIDLPGLTPIAAELGQDPALQQAFKRYFPYGIQPLVEGRSLQTVTDDSGRYFLPVPPATSGFVSCALQPDLSVSTFIEPRQPDVILTGQNVLPPTELFTKLIIPQLAERDIQPTEVNFFSDIGTLGNINGPVRVDTIQTADGQTVVDTEGETCGLLVNSPPEGGIQYVAAGAVSFYASALFKALLIETREPTTATFGDILGNILRRTDDTGRPNAVVLPEDLIAGGVPQERATVLATALTECIQAGIVDLVGPALLLRMVLAGRVRILVVEADSGNPLPNARVEVTGDFTAFDNAGSGCPGQGDALELEDGRIVCETNDAGIVTFVLLGNQPLDTTPLMVNVVSADMSQTGQLAAAIAPPATVDATVMTTASP